MTSYAITASCPRCGGELIPGDHEEHAPDHVSAEARCDRCLDLWRIDVTASMLEAWPVDRIDPDARLQRARNATADASLFVPGMLR